MFQVHGNGVEDCLTYIGQRQKDKDQTFYKYCGQSLLPAVTHTKDNGVREICV